VGGVGEETIFRDDRSWSMSRKFEGSYRVWISKISRDLSGRIGEILEL